jgi:hypothetical protein
MKKVFIFLVFASLYFAMPFQQSHAQMWFSQNNPSWACNTLGNCLGTNIGYISGAGGSCSSSYNSAGCTITCLAMLYNGVYTPATLNDWLKSHGNYDPNCYLYWSSPIPNGVSFIGTGSSVVNSYNELYSHITSGQKAIVNVTYPGSTQAFNHWVLVYGFTGTYATQSIASNYLVYDPATSNSTLHPNLASFPSGFQRAHYYGVSSLTSCQTTTGINVYNLLSTSCNLSWNQVSNAQSYVVEYKPNVSGYTYWNSYSVSTNQIYLTALLSNSPYQVRIKTNCYGGGQSDYTYFSFNTPGSVVCYAPGGVSISNLLSTSCNLSWNQVSSAQSYIVEYKPNISGYTYWNSYSVSTSQIYLTALLSNSPYQVRIKTNCYGGGQSDYTYFSFNTPGSISCQAPGNASLNAVSSNSATISWQNVTGSSYYELSYRPSYSGSWTVLTTSGANFNFNALQPSTYYYFQLRSYCGSGYSNYSSVYFFVTNSSGGGSCPTPLGVSYNVYSGTNASTYWNGSGVNNFNLRLRPTGNNWWWSWNNWSYTSAGFPWLTNNTCYEFQVQQVCNSGTLSSWSNSISFCTYAHRSAVSNNSDSSINADTALNAIELYLSANSSINIYPNPISSGGVLQIVGISKDSKIILLSMDGKTVYTDICTGNDKFSFSIPPTSAGIYILRVEGSDGNVSINKLAIQ